MKKKMRIAALLLGLSALLYSSASAQQTTGNVTGRVLDAAYQRRWLDSLQAKDPSMPDGQQYGYGMERLRWGPNAVYVHGGETVGYNAHMGYDPNSQVTFVTWTNLPLSVDGEWASVGTANFDNRSLYLNFEVNGLFYSPAVAAELEAMFLRDLASSIRLDREQFGHRPFASRVAENACRLLSPVL